VREAFHAELDALGARLGVMCGLAGDALECAMRAVLDVDLPLAEQVIVGDTEIDALRAENQEHAFNLLSLQAPVGRDLRLVVSGIKVAERIERMGDLARHVAALARLRHPAHVVPPGLVEFVEEMGSCAVAISRSVQPAVAAPTIGQWELRCRDDDRVDELQKELLAAVQRGTDVRAGVDVALLARFVERFADQAVAVARCLDHIVAGRPAPRGR
jgi:phosphate transport system protein